MAINKRNLFQSMRNTAYISSRGNSNSFCRPWGCCLRFHFFNWIALLPSLAQKNCNFYDFWEEKKSKGFSFSDKKCQAQWILKNFSDAKSRIVLLLKSDTNPLSGTQPMASSGHFNDQVASTSTGLCLTKHLHRNGRITRKDKTLVWTAI